MKELLNELCKWNECMVPTQHLQHIQTIEWIKVKQIHFVLILVLFKLLIKIFSSKISSATGYANIIFQKNNFVRIAAAVIYLHVALWGNLKTRRSIDCSKTFPRWTLAWVISNVYLLIYRNVIIMKNFQLSFCK